MTLESHYQELVNLRSKETFVAAHSHPFLVRIIFAQPAGGDGHGAFRTQALSGAELQALLAQRATGAPAVPSTEPWTQVFAMVKRPDNPYQGRISIGRTKNNDIVIEHPAISKMHCMIQEAASGYTVQDTGSRNGVTVNGAPISANAPAPLKPGDLIGLGSVSLRFLDPAGFYDFIKRNPQKSG